MINTKIFLLAVVALATIFYLWGLGRADIVTDESSYATRAIGLVDFDFGFEQPTPWQWVDEIPWWMRLSFHDHPPLVFWLQHWSIRLFGENPIAIRIPSALAGIASVILLYFIGKRLYSPTVGALSALLFAVTTNHVWISRIGLQESILIAFILASTAAFLKGLERPRWLPLSGALLGFSFLVKYIALILIPIFLTILAVRHHSYLKNFYFLFSVFLFLIVASPVIVYNIQLARNFGHFDFQISLLLGQDVPAWQSRPGQEVLGSYANRITNFIPWLVQSNSPYFLILAALGLATILWRALGRRFRENMPLVIIFLWLLPFLVFIGPAPRFLAILTPWLALAAGYALAATGYSQILKNLRIAEGRAAAIIVLLIAAIEGLYAYNSVIALDPISSKPWAYSHLRRQAHSWGFNELNAYLDETMIGKMPDPAITFEFPFAQEILKRARATGQAKGLEAVPWGIVYDGNINLSAQLWVFLRRITYQGWPIADAETFRRGGGQEFWQEAGVKTVLFIAATDRVLKDRPRLPSPDADSMEAELRQRGEVPREIKNARGEIAFRVYEFSLE